MEPLNWREEYNRAMKIATENMEKNFMPGWDMWNGYANGVRWAGENIIDKLQEK